VYFFCENFGQCPSPSWYTPHLLCLRNARAFPLLPAALASVSFGFVLVRVRVRVYASFDESLVGRRCWLRDFTLLQSKAGPGATRDEERLANLGRELYQEHVDLPFEDATESSSPGNASAPSGGVERRSAEDDVNQEVDEDEET